MKLDDDLMTSDEQIDWVLSRPAMSPWRKNTLAAARDRDPVDVLNDLEILNYLLRARSDARIRSAFITGTSIGTHSS